jgi:hypothetical protein
MEKGTGRNTRIAVFRIQQGSDSWRTRIAVFAI